MNKHFYVVNVRNKPKGILERILVGEKYPSYIWPTDNWVEVHTFKNMEFSYEREEVNYSYNRIQEAGMEFWGMVEYGQGTVVEAKWANFNDLIDSFIIERSEVDIAHSNKGISDILVNPKKEDFDRWGEWHPDNNYLTRIRIKDSAFFMGNKKVLLNNFEGWDFK